jgi:hypothetical protein
MNHNKKNTFGLLDLVSYIEILSFRILLHLILSFKMLFHLFHYKDL